MLPLKLANLYSILEKVFQEAQKLSNYLQDELAQQLLEDIRMGVKMARKLYDETRTDFSRWKGIYETWLRRKRSYTEQIIVHTQVQQKVRYGSREI